MINVTINIRIIDNTTTVTDIVIIVEVLVSAFLWLVSMMLWTMLKVLRVESKLLGLILMVLQGIIVVVASTAADDIVIVDTSL